MATATSNQRTLDVDRVRADFPILNREARPGIPLVYLDSTATSQKPQGVIEAMDMFYRRSNANIHRGIHVLAEEATAQYEAARQKVAAFIGAPAARQVIFTRNTTESINLVANAWGRANLHTGDVVILTEMEHHSNLVPWQMIAQERGVQLEFIPVTDEGLLDMDAYRRLLEKQPKLVAFTHMSNVLGTINPVDEICRLAHSVGALALIDGAQSAPHLPVNVQAMDCDFYAFSGHKMLAPLGIGVLYGRQELLERMRPFLYGGDMIAHVTLEHADWNRLPWKFEAGTANVAGGVALGGAVDVRSGQALDGAVTYLQRLGMEQVRAHEVELTQRALAALDAIPGVRTYGPRDLAQRGGVVSFNVEGMESHLVARLLDDEGIAVRSGGHCAYPCMDALGVPGTARASFYIYNTLEEVDRLAEVLAGIAALSHRGEGG